MQSEVEFEIHRNFNLELYCTRIKWRAIVHPNLSALAPSARLKDFAYAKKLTRCR
jgi:hypothetical protein